MSNKFGKGAIITCNGLGNDTANGVFLEVLRVKGASTADVRVVSRLPIKWGGKGCEIEDFNVLGGMVRFRLATKEELVSLDIKSVKVKAKAQLKSKMVKITTAPTKLVKLTNQVSGIAVGEVITVETRQTVSGGGSRNLITWSLLASKKGFKTLLIKAPSANSVVLKTIEKAVGYANDMVNHLGLTVILEK